jgi:tRNA(Ile)-lysidine synthase
VEERARQVRYQCLGQLALAQNMPMVLLAQHADDQLETVLLAMLRGSGVAGLAGMPSMFKRHGVQFGRPFLHVAKQSIEQCASQAQWPFVPDPSNQDKKFTRNLLRHEVVPLLKQCFPHVLSTVGRVAEHCADVHGLMQEMAEQDWVSIGAAPLIEPMRQLPVRRQSQVIRHWFLSMGQRAPSTVQLRELQKQIAACATKGHQIRVKAGAGHVMRKNNALIFVADL